MVTIQKTYESHDNLQIQSHVAEMQKLGQQVFSHPYINDILY